MLNLMAGRLLLLTGCFSPHERTVWEPAASRQTRKLDLDAPSRSSLNVQPPEDLKCYPVDQTSDGMLLIYTTVIYLNSFTDWLL